MNSEDEADDVSKLNNAFQLNPCKYLYLILMYRKYLDERMGNMCAMEVWMVKCIVL